MNSEENNEQQIEKLSRMEQIYADEKKHESVLDSMELEDEDICAPARKVFKWALLITWAACAVSLVTGGDFTIAISSMLFAGGVYAGLCVTKFLHKKKMGDVIVSALIAVATIALGIILLTADMRY